MKENKKIVQIFSIVALVLSVVGISIGFAAMQTSLTITGSAKVVPASWDIKFTANEFSNNSTSANNNSVTPTMTDTTFSDYEIVLTKPGDKGTYLVTVTNNGDIDAKVSSVTIGSPLTYTGDSADVAIVQNNVEYSITWDDGSAITMGNELAAKSSKIVKIEVSYDTDAQELPSGPVTITGKDVTMLFTQK